MIQRGGGRILPYEGRWPQLGPGVWIAPGAVVVGDVRLGSDVSVWYGSVLRGDVHRVRVGARSNVQDGSVLHVTRDRFPTEVGQEVSIGHRAVVHGCTVGDGALIGIGAVVLDGASVGEGALVGAGAVVTPGFRVPPRSLVLGTPARVVRSLSDAELALQRARTLKYVETARRHAAAEQEEAKMVEVKVSDRIEASADAVWELLRDFGGVQRYSAGIESCTLEGEGVGAVRTLTMPGGVQLKERLEALDDAARTLQYAIVGGPLPLERYLATIAVHEDGDACTIDWSSTFEPKGISDDQARSMIQGVYQGGIAGLRKALGG